MKKPHQAILKLTLAVLLALAQPAVIWADSASSPTPDSGTTTQNAAATDSSGGSTGSGGSTTSDSSNGSTTGSGGGTGSKGTDSATTPAPPTTTGADPASTGPQTPPGNNQPTGPIPTYAFDDASNHWVPTIQSSFTWNQSLSIYTSPLYSYNSQTGWYHVIPTAFSVAPTGGAIVGTSGTPAPVATTSTTGSGTVGSGSNNASSPMAALAQLLGVGSSDPSVSNTGPGSNNKASVVDTNNAMLKLLTNAMLSNTDTSTAATGDANVSGNTSGGNATTGAATVINNLLNLLNAAWSWSNGGLSYFMQNILGNQNGDITLNPTSISGGGGSVGSYNPAAGGGTASTSGTGPGSTNSATQTGNTNLTVVNQPTGSITNNVNAMAQSGNANVTSNTNGGNATSGSALANVNILNLINSAINAGQSFFGVLNILGNLNGDILFPQGFLNGALGSSSPAGSSGGGGTASNSNTGPNSTNTASTDQSTNANLTNNSSAAFNNNVNTAAQSGAANVGSNTNAGSATSGSSTTQNNLYNLSNSSLFGDNAVLVLVNVMGHWVGQIMNLPGTADGTSSGLLTGNATVSNTNTGPGSSNTASENQSGNLNITNKSTGTITNNVNAGAASGSANVSGNTNGGNATSGNAGVATNIANIFNSHLSLTHWFGVLVVNVFGNWIGDVGQNTSAGDSVTGSGGASQAGTANAVSNLKTAGVVHTSSSISGQGSTGSDTSGTASTANATGFSLLNASHTSHPLLTPTVVKNATAATGFMAVLAAIAILLAGGAMGLERKFKQQ